MTVYSTIEQGEVPSIHDDTIVTSKSSPLLTVLIGSIATLLVITTGSTMYSQNKTVPLMMGSSSAGSHARPCTFTECFAAPCNKEIAPYICEFHNGGPHGGCSSIPWIEGT